MEFVKSYNDWLMLIRDELIKVSSGIGVYLDFSPSTRSLEVSFTENGLGIDIPSEFKQKFNWDFEVFTAWLISEIKLDAVLSSIKYSSFSDDIISYVSNKVGDSIMNHYKRTGKTLGDHFLSHFGISHVSHDSSPNILATVRREVRVLH